MFFWQFRLKLGRSRCVRGERTEHTQLFSRTLAGFGLTRRQKVHFSTFAGRLKFQCTRNDTQNHPFCPGPPQNTFIICLRFVNLLLFQSMLYERQSARISIYFSRFANKRPVYNFSLSLPAGLHAYSARSCECAASGVATVASSTDNA